MNKEITTGAIKESLQELTEFLRENMVTKEDLKEELKQFATKDDLKNGLNGLRQELKSDIAGVRQELKSDIDDLRSEMRTEFSLVKSELEDIKDKLDRVKKMLQEDVIAAMEDIEKLKKRVLILEKQLKAFKGAA
ncbi:MAG: hypothetical protein AAB731_00655 [Patescibacteria group bacterium]